MKALILAAGIGSRLAPITNDYPKSLVKINGKAILIKQIENLKQNGINSITIVAGYKADILINSVKEYVPEINIIVNKKYDTTNNMYSAFMGKNEVIDSDFIMMNADVFFDAVIIDNLLKFKAKDAIVVDIGTFIDESMKVVEKNKRIVQISKQIEKHEAYGVSIDVYKFSKFGGKVFFDKCAKYINEMNDVTKWSEVAINDILSDVCFEPCPLIGRWIEIDNYDDLKAAERLFNDER